MKFPTFSVTLISRRKSDIFLLEHDAHLVGSE